MVTDRRAAKRTGTDKVLVIDTVSEYSAQSFGQDGQTPLDYRTGLPGVETGVGAGTL